MAALLGLVVVTITRPIEVLPPAAWKILLIAGPLLFLLAGLRLGFSRCLLARALDPYIWSWALLLFLFSDYALLRAGTFVEGNAPFAAVVLAAGALGAGGAVAFRRALSPARLGAVLFLAQACALGLFLSVTDGRLIFSDDHPSFLYRLQLLRENFPDIPFYNPAWNAGYSAREFFPSGVLNIYALSWPLVHIVDLSTVSGALVYNFIVPYLLLLLVPWTVWGAARLTGHGHTVAITAALLALSPTRSFYEFGLKFGTVPFALSAAMLPLALVLVVRIFRSGLRPSWTLTSAAAVVATLVLSWHLIVIAFLPLAIWALWNFRSWRQPSYIGRLLVFIGIVAAAHALSLVTLLREADLARLFTRDSLPGTASGAEWDIGALISGAIRNARIAAHKINPLLAVFALPGLAVLRRPYRQVFSATIFWLLALASFGPDLKPQLELHRMAIPAAFLLTIPVAAVLVRALGSAKFLGAKGWGRRRQVSMALAIGMVFYTMVNAGFTWANRGGERFSLAPRDLPDLVQAVKDHGGPGRVFVSGFILHDYGAHAYNTQDGGHIAPLAAFTGREFYASHYYHVYWSTVDPIPQSYRSRGAEGIEEFLDLINATSVLTFRREWTKYCRRQAGYREVWSSGRFHLFVRTHASNSYFAEGRGRVEVQDDGVIVFPQTPVSVVKFRYVPQLAASAGAELSPAHAFVEEIGEAERREVSFVRIAVDDELLKSGRGVRIGY